MELAQKISTLIMRPGFISAEGVVMFALSKPQVVVLETELVRRSRLGIGQALKLEVFIQHTKNPQIHAELSSGDEIIHSFWYDCGNKFSISSSVAEVIELILAKENLKSYEQTGNREDQNQPDKIQEYPISPDEATQRPEGYKFDQ
jgi:hypothetical protein